ncbi:RagB/SusD family nutrient uptake outer membrane protein [Flammeovirga sp. EKP202]|uniref:RagB/SusD family nutrient uptake outer membrane protein n=1 Tax=Flammeovirga sp. EKP202 TaxID=2770592 RepID=UPI00165F1585|nr:RagB/SusD family nutrient uptake outer membrane protein [Flammeovirga sp. EKP202]MBD0401813.1 RagB/SusD family nutrient uptake outer membrane protein [Flammeovirga sp. EKP202]
MKFISKIFVGLALSAALSSCTDYFDVENVNTITEDSFWQNREDAFKGLMATYSGLQGHGVTGGTSAVNTPVRSDTGRPNNWNAGAQSLQKLSFNDNTNVVKEKWADLYTAILRANQVIEKVPGIEMDEEEKALFIAEARFVRGVCYYWLYSTYNHGSVILHKTVPASKEDFAKPLAPKEDVLAFLMEDLVHAQENLPEEWDDNNLGRATWGAATGFLGHVYINEHNYEQARVEYKKLIDRTDLYQLTPEISWNFDTEHEFNSESIFEVVFSATQKAGSAAAGAQDGPTGSEGTTRARTLAPGGAGGWRVVMPSYWMTMQLKEDPMDPDDSRNDDRVYSLRCEASIALADDGTTYYQQEVEKAGFNNNEASYLRKFQNHQNTNDGLGDVYSSGINERIIRLADIYLLYAECILELNGDGAVNEAANLVNQIRARSGVMQIDPVNYTAKSLMEHIMWDERPKELMFEGHDTRWVDLRRWDKVKEQYDRLSKLEFTIQEKNLRYITDEDVDIVPLREYVEGAAAYTPLAHDYFPIPVDEALTNPNINN